MTEASPAPPRHLLATLSASFKVFRDCLPLAIGIHKAIKARSPEMDPQQLKVAMRMHTASTRYLKVLSQADTRFDLDDAPAGEVTAEQRQQALDTLRDRFKKQADRHKAEELAKQHQEKLQQLAAKFNTR
jgi:ProP effector